MSAMPDPAHSASAVLCSVGSVNLTLDDVLAAPEEVVTAASMSEKGSHAWGLVRLQLAAAIKEAA